MDLFTYVNSKLACMERHIRSQIVSLYNEVTLQQCELENKVLESLLLIARLVRICSQTHERTGLYRSCNRRNDAYYKMYSGRSENEKNATRNFQSHEATIVYSYCRLPASF